MKIYYDCVYDIKYVKNIEEEYSPQYITLYKNIYLLEKLYNKHFYLYKVNVQTKGIYLWYPGDHQYHEYKLDAGKFYSAFLALRSEPLRITISYGVEGLPSFDDYVELRSNLDIPEIEE